MWSKLDSEGLKAEADKFDKNRKKLAKTYDDNIIF